MSMLSPGIVVWIPDSAVLGNLELEFRAWSGVWEHLGSEAGDWSLGYRGWGLGAEVLDLESGVLVGAGLATGGWGLGTDL